MDGMQDDDFADFRKSLQGLGGAERKAQLKAMEDAILENWRTQVVPDLYVDDEPVADVVAPEAKPAPAPAPMPQQQPVKTAPPQPFRSVIDDEDAEPVDPAALMMTAGPAGAPAAQAMQAQRGTPRGTYKPPFGRGGDAEGERPDWTQDYPFSLSDDNGETDQWFEEKFGNLPPEQIQQAISDLSGELEQHKEGGTYGGDASMMIEDVLNRLQAKAGAGAPKRKMSMMGPAR